MTTLAVTGASGFCGRHVLDRARAAGHTVVSVGRTHPGSVAHRPWDATSGEPPALDGVDVVVHLAALVGDGGDHAAMHRANVEGTRAVLEGARRTGARVVHISTASVYDVRAARSGPVAEDGARGRWISPYGRTKALAEDLVLAAGQRVLRPRAVYGPGDRTLLPRLVAAVRRGRLVVPGDDVLLSLTHVANLAEAAVQARSWAPGAYNVADESAVRRDALLRDAVTAATGVAPQLVHVPAPVLDAMAFLAQSGARLTGRPVSLTRYAVEQLSVGLVLDTTRARATGWRPTHTLADHLTRLGAGRAAG